MRSSRYLITFDFNFHTTTHMIHLHTKYHALRTTLFNTPHAFRLYTSRSTLPPRTRFSSLSPLRFTHSLIYLLYTSPSNISASSIRPHYVNVLMFLTGVILGKIRKSHYMRNLDKDVILIMNAKGVERV